MKLSDFKNVQDLKTLSYVELEELADDLRQLITEECNNTEGHLGSNLAIVDLTLSLLRHFGYEKCRYLFDTSYQAYAYKRLTNRHDFFEKLHIPEGYSIFQEMEEGDPYSGGHTSISAVWASGYKQLNDSKLTIEIIGDASLATSVGLGGMLNFAKSDNKGLFILNDNQQGIGINQFNYLNWKDIATGMGFIYFEVDGHDFGALEKVWKEIDNFNKSIFVKVNTIKGYRFKGDFNKDESLHYVMPKIKLPDDMCSSIMHFTKNFLPIVLSNNKNAMLFHAGMNWAFGLNELKEKYNTQIVDSGIAEEVAIVEACAAAAAGKEVYFMVSSTFFQRCYDQIVHDVIRNNANVKIVIMRAEASIIGDSHHGIYDLNMYNAFENVYIFNPSNIGEFDLALADAKNYEGPAVIRTSTIMKNAESNVKTSYKWLSTKPNSKNVLITYGSAYYQIKEEIEKNNYDINLVLATTLNPIDDDLIKDLIKNKDVIYSYEHTFWKNNLASTIRAKHPGIVIKDFAFKNTFIGRWGMNEILKRNKMDIVEVLSEINHKK